MALKIPGAAAACWLAAAAPAAASPMLLLLGPSPADVSRLVEESSAAAASAAAALESGLAAHAPAVPRAVAAKAAADSPFAGCGSGRAAVLSTHAALTDGVQHPSLEARRGVATVWMEREGCARQVVATIRFLAERTDGGALHFAVSEYSAVAAVRPLPRRDQP